MTDLRIRELRQKAARLYIHLLDGIFEAIERGEINEEDGEDIIILTEITKKAMLDLSEWYVSDLKRGE